MFFFPPFSFFLFKCRARGPPSSRRQGRLASGSVAYLGRVYTPRTPPLQPENKPPFPPPTLPSPPTQPAVRPEKSPTPGDNTGSSHLADASRILTSSRSAVSLGVKVRASRRSRSRSRVPPPPPSPPPPLPSLPPSLVLQPSARTLSNPYHLSDVSPPPSPPSRRRSSNGGKQGEEGKQPREGWKKNKKNTLRGSEARAPGRTVRGRIRIYHLNLPSDLIGWSLCIPWRGPIRFYVSHSGY